MSSAAVESLFQEYIADEKRVVLAVDHEGVLLPYAYPNLIPEQDFFGLEDRRVLAAVHRLPINTFLLGMLSRLSSTTQKAQVEIASASSLDVLDLKALGKMQLSLQYGRERCRQLLKAVNPAAYTLLNSPRPDGTHWIFINDLAENNLPPEPLKSQLKKHPNSDTFTVSAVQYPRFIGQITDEHTQIALQAMATTFSQNT